MCVVGRGGGWGLKEIQKGASDEKVLTLCDSDCGRNTIPANGTRFILGECAVSKALPNSAP